MTNFWYIHGDFTRERSTRIGASDIPKIIPNPERPTESLAGYGQTAVTLWEEKTGRRTPEPAGFPAEMGHWNEPKAIEMFIRGISPDDAEEYILNRMTFEILKMRNPDTRPEAYQTASWKHNVQWYNDDFIVHPDTVYVPQGKPETRIKYEIVDEHGRVTAHGFAIDLSAPFLIEAKSARFFSAHRPEGSLVSGYDPELKTWQGIPLKNYVQIQFQLLLLEVEICYLPLIYDTSSFHVWEIRADAKIQNQLIDISGRMAWHIKKDIPPKELAISLDDIKTLYPEIKEDFVYLSGEEAANAREYQAAYWKAKKQEDIWRARKEEASDSLGTLLRDRGKIKDADGDIAGWMTRKGAERVMGAKEMKQAEPDEYNRLKEKGLISMSEGSKYVSVARMEE